MLSNFIYLFLLLGFFGIQGCEKTPIDCRFSSSLQETPPYDKGTKNLVSKIKIYKFDDPAIKTGALGEEDLEKFPIYADLNNKKQIDQFFENLIKGEIHSNEESKTYRFLAFHPKYKIICYNNDSTKCGFLTISTNSDKNYSTVATVKTSDGTNSYTFNNKIIPCLESLKEK